MPSGERASTTVAPQALFMLNSKLMHEQTRKMAERLLREPVDDVGRVRLVYEKAYGGLPTTKETARSLHFVRRSEETLETEKMAAREVRLRSWQSLCRAVLAANEFISVE